MAISKRPAKEAGRGPVVENEMTHGASAPGEPPSRMPSPRRAASALTALVLSLSAPAVSVGRTMELPLAPGAASSRSHAARSGIELALLDTGTRDAGLGADDAEEGDSEEQGTASADADDDSGESESADGIGGGMVASADADDDESGSKDEDDRADAGGGGDGDQEMAGSDSDEDMAGADDGEDDDGMTGSDSDEDFDGGGDD